MLTIFLFILGFVLLIKGADMLVDGAVSVSRKFGISDIVAGLTIVSFGTSTPELVVSILASIEGSSEIAVGNVLGSNIANVLVILGVSSLIFPLTVNKDTTFKEIPFALLSAVVVLILGNDIIFSGHSDSLLSVGDGLILLCFFAIFMYYIFSISGKGSGPATINIHLTVSKSVLYIVAGLTGMIVGGHWIVDGAILFASSMGVSESLIGLTIVALGTSLPELATSAVAAFKKNSEIAIGNVVGSNIFNMFWILGISSVIHPLPVLERNDVDFFVNISANALLFIFLFIGQRQTLQKWQGAFFILCYVLYLSFIINLG